LHLMDQGPALEICWVVATGNDARAHEARASAADYASASTSIEVIVGDLREGYLPYIGGAAKDFVHGVAAQFEPDVIFTHRGDDRHQDHRLLNELVGNAFRRQPVLCFEIPKYDGDLATPNLYVPVTTEQAHRKVELLTKHFETQATKQWFDPVVFLGLMRLRGVECDSPSGFAEGFSCRKLAVSWTR